MDRDETSPTDRVDPRRMEAVEVKAAFLEHTVAELDEVIRELFDRIGRLERDVTELREERMEMGDRPGETPPHY